MRSSRKSRFQFFCESIFISFTFGLILPKFRSVLSRIHFQQPLEQLLNLNLNLNLEQLSSATSSAVSWLCTRAAFKSPP